jgi:hypothetical protein
MDNWTLISFSRTLCLHVLSMKPAGWSLRSPFLEPELRFESRNGSPGASRLVRFPLGTAPSLIPLHDSAPCRKAQAKPEFMPAAGHICRQRLILKAGADGDRECWRRCRHENSSHPGRAPPGTNSSRCRRGFCPGKATYGGWLPDTRRSANLISGFPWPPVSPHKVNRFDLRALRPLPIRTRSVLVPPQHQPGRATRAATFHYLRNSRPGL